MNRPAEWEYSYLKADAPTASVEQLNIYGSKGWLLVSVYPLERQWIYVFARRNGEGDR